jgi:hypothetical protein
MEMLLTQKFSYATISLFRNYSFISDKLTTENVVNTLNNNHVIVELHGNAKRKHTRYFYSNLKNENDYGYFYKRLDDFITIDDKQIKRNYGNPLASIVINNYERTIRRDGDNLYIKFTHYIKSRPFNFRYFTKIIESVTLTFNMKTGNFRTTIYSKTGRKTAVKFRVNNFALLETFFIGNNSQLFSNKSIVKNKNFKYKAELENAFNYDHIHLIKQLGFSVNSNTNPFQSFVKKFIELKKIKAPDHDCLHLLKKFYPTEKFLKKNDRKLLASVLDLLKLKSKLTIKLLHEHPNMDLVFVGQLVQYLGNDYTKYLSQLNPNLLTHNFGDHQYNPGRWDIQHTQMRVINFNINSEEKQNIINVFNDYDELGNNKTRYKEGILNDIYDHFNMIDKVKFYIPETQFNAKTYNDFLREHSYLSGVVRKIKKAWTIEYQYDEKTLSEIEAPITDIETGEIFYPYILKRNEDYESEGDHMHHCVGTYSDKEQSMIISLRTKDGNDRVTCEYRIQDGYCIQQRSFCNAAPPEHFTNALEDLCDKVRILARLGTLNWKEKKKVRMLINGQEVKQEVEDFPWHLR